MTTLPEAFGGLLAFFGLVIICIGVRMIVGGRK